MFFLRCAFWLTVMYVGISYGFGGLRSPHAFETAIADEASSAATTVVARATDWCAERPARCARDAARLTALVEMTASSSAAGSDEAILAETQTSRAPLPIADPRRRAARAVLTETR